MLDNLVAIWAVRRWIIRGKESRIGQREFYVAGIPGQTRDLAFRAVGGEEF
jgi:hypothetical protein